MTNYSKLALSYHAHAGHLTHPSLMENSLIEQKVVSAITHGPAKSLGTKIIQTAMFAGSDASSFTAI